MGNYNLEADVKLARNCLKDILIEIGKEKPNLPFGEALKEAKPVLEANFQGMPEDCGYSKMQIMILGKEKLLKEYPIVAATIGRYLTEHNYFE